MSTQNTTPTVSVGLAVRNDPQRVRRCIESVLAQDLTDLELVICDNASDDDTVETVEEYAREDRRVTVAVNPVNIGVNENMNRVLKRSRGTLFRWISADDWLEPNALSEAVRALERRGDAIGVTSGFTIHESGAAPRFEHYPGEFPSSPDASRRFERMLWFFHAGDAKYDPMYGVYRREPLMRTGLVRRNERADWLLSAELALTAPIVHIPERLAHRTNEHEVRIDHAAYRRRLDPTHADRLRSTPTSLSRELYALARSANLTQAQLDRCRTALRSFWVREMKRIQRKRLAGTAHRVLGR